MPKSSPAKLAYQAKRNAEPEQKKRRAMNNAARREAMAAGLVHKGDGKDVDHIKPLDKGGTNAKVNLRVTSAHANRGWRKDNGDMYGD